MTGKAAQEGLSIEVLLLANYVEAINGLLYISGGAWTEHYRVIQPGGGVPLSNLAVALSVLIPWNETNQPHHLKIRIENEDATQAVVEVQGQLNVGRPPNLPQGAVQHAVLAIPMTVNFPSGGGYRVVAKLDDGVDERVWSFRVHDLPGAPVQVPPAHT